MNYKRLGISIILPQLAGLAGSFFTAPAVSGWYSGLARPAFSPPNWIFGPVWITLYLMMGISIYLVWNYKGIHFKRKKEAMRLFWVHLFFNAIWSPIFFGLKSPGIALLDIIIIWAFIVVLIFKFLKINRRAAWLLVPYFFWVGFASLLNFAIWILN